MTRPHRNGLRSPTRRKWRLALYSHDTMGIGHMRRNLLIARSLLASVPLSSGLLIAGAQQAASFTMPQGIDCVTLPSLCKHETGRYRSRSLRMSLKRLVALRSGIILAALESYQPDVLIVDKAPRGAEGELDDVLASLRQRGRTRCVLGLREVLDDPELVRKEWRTSANEDAIDAYYDAVWIYGDPEIYDSAREYAFRAATMAKVRYTGYFDQRQRLSYWQHEEDAIARLNLPDGPLMLCMVGGGEDGEALAESFVSAPLPHGACGVLLTGPLMPAATRRRLQSVAADSPRKRVIEFVSEPSWLLERADRIVTMGGYNTVTEAISFQKRTLVVPRVTPRREQWIRAMRLRDLGLVDVLPPDEISPTAIGVWLARDLPRPPSPHGRFDFTGLSRLPHLVSELLAHDHSSAQTRNPTAELELDFQEPTVSTANPSGT